jgi:hypothetical protein
MKGLAMRLDTLAVAVRTICLTLVAVTTAWPAAHPAAANPIEMKKISWDVGTYTSEDGSGDVTYKDAHLKLATTGTFLNNPAPTVEKDGFTNAPPPQIINMPGPGDDCLIMTWDVGADPALTGKHHLGGTFSFDTNGNPLANDVKVAEAYLTGATVPALGITAELARLDVPGPTGFRERRTKSVDWEFLNDFPVGSPDITYSDVMFFKTATEPALSDLTAVNFPSLGATFLQAEPDFVLPGAGPDALAGHFVHVLGVDAPEWIIATYTTSWVDPGLSAAAGKDVTVSVNQWAANLVVPEPSSLWLLIGAWPVVTRRRR